MQQQHGNKASTIARAITYNSPISVADAEVSKYPRITDIIDTYTV